MKTAFVGIDPGTRGAVAVVCAGFPGGFGLELVFVRDIPVLTLGKSSRVNAMAVALMLKEARTAADRVMVVLENVASRPDQGGRSIFTFGRAVGALEAVAQTSGLPWDLVTPVVWKRWAGLVGKDKDQSRAVAGQRLPAAVPYLTRKKDVDRADAVLMALWLQDKYARLTGAAS